jgi:beta-phosphoglucomutase-like phosphatase (HAD superfamily)
MPGPYTPADMKAIPAKIHAIIYDFDNTIVESERLNDTMFADLLRREYGVEITDEDRLLLYGFSWGGIFRWLQERRGFHVDRAEVWERFMETKRRFLAGHELRVASGLDRMLSLPVPKAIVSGSTREELHLMLENISIAANAVDFILSEEDGGIGKPDPAGFLHAIERFGVPAGDALVFEDSPAGIEAAHRAGIPVAFVAELASRDSSAQADLRFDSFIDAYPWVKARVE